MSRWRPLLVVLSGVVYAGGAQWLMLYHADAPWALVMLLGPLAAAAIGLCAARFGAWGLVLSLAAVGVLGALAVAGESGVAGRLYMLQHVAVNLLLCAWFGSTLRPDRLSLIGSFAQRVHPLSADQVRYTRHVTWAWTVLFAFLALASALAFALLPFSVWSTFANVVSPCAMAALFIGEYLLRYRLHPEFERTTLAQAIRAFSMPDSADGSR